MSKDKVLALTKYVDGLKRRLAAAIPVKHAHRVGQYKAWLEREIEVHSKKIEQLTSK